MEHPEHDRHRHIGRIGMPDAVAEAVEAPAVVSCAQPALFVEVRDIPDFAQRQAPFAALSGRPADFELAEFAAKSRNSSSLRRWS